MTAIRVLWEPRQPPLAPCACLARGAVARALGQALLASDAARLSKLTAVAGDAALVVLADDDEHLPWVDGVVYLGRDAAAPGLLLPTAQKPDVPIDLFWQALVARGAAAGPCAVLPEPDGALLVVSVSRPAAIVAASLQAWLEATP